MKQEVKIKGKQIFIMIAVLFIAIYIVLRKESMSTCMMVLVSMKIVIEECSFLLLVVGLFQYCRYNQMNFSRMIQYVREKLAE